MSTLSGTEDSRIFDDSTENSRYKYHDDADVETPEYVSINEVISSLPDISEATLSGSGRGDGRGGGEVPLERYTVATIQGDQTDVMTEGDVIESIEESSNHLKGSARNILLPQLTDDRGQDFETKSPPISPKGKRSNRVVSLRDLTAQLIIASGDRDTDRKGCDGATRGTAADRMADTAEIMFSSKGDLPDGIHFDVEGRPKIDVEKLPNEAKGTLRKKFQATRDHIKENKDLFVDFLRPRKKFIWGFWWIRFKFLILPGSCIAALLFYACGNPPHGKLNKVNGEYVDDKFGTTPATASVSWWILFIAVRQVITFASAEMWELFLVDFLSFKTRILTSLFGPYVSLWIAQSKGWPFRAIVWGITNLIFLSGSRDFVNHWGYFQGWIDLFNGRNPSGNVLENRFYNSLILCSIGFGGATVAKRAILSNIVGKRLVVNYGDQLENLMKDVLLVTHIAVLSKKIAKGKLVEDAIDDLKEMTSKFDVSEESTASLGGAPFGSFSFYQSQNNGGVMTALGEWEEPELQQERQQQEKVTISSLLHFRRALAFIDAEYPFSEAFGPASTRQLCIDSSQQVFEQLARDSDVISFGLFTPLVKDLDGNLDPRKMKELCKMLPPSREGTLSKLDFVKSIDNVYKTLRTLVASIESSSQIEQNYESIVNAMHYSILIFVGLGIIGLDIQAMMVSIGAFFVGVGFIIGNACSKFLEGLLMIFFRRPFDVGDRIAIGDVTQATDPEGSFGWIVEKVDLYSTTMRFAPTREVATVTNGELATTRIINLYRSKKALVYIILKFGVEVPKMKVDLLKREIQDFVAARPREWVALIAFRMTEIQADQGFVAYTITLQHRDAWQNVVNVLTSKAEVSSFALELSKGLGMRYIAPSLPVELSLNTAVGDRIHSKSESEQAVENLMKVLESKKDK